MPLSGEVIILRSKNYSPEQTHLLSCDNINDGTVCHIDDIQIDDHRSQGLPTSINFRFVPSIPQERDSGCNGEPTQNKYVNFFFQIREKSDIDIGLNKIVVL